MKLGIVLPSRGTMFSKTMESVFSNLKNLRNKTECELYMAHGRPIPECFNEPLEKALDDGCDWIWFVEEDMIIPSDTLQRMFLVRYPVVTVDYADRRTGIPLILRDNVGDVLFSGMGCMIIHKDVFGKMEKPYCRPMVFWKKEQDNGDILYEPHPEIKQTSYGTQDIYLCWAIRKAGYEIAELKNANIGHMNLLSKAEDIVNNGGDTIKTVYINAPNKREDN